jgi:hypothetical protein
MSEAQRRGYDFPLPRHLLLAHLRPDSDVADFAAACGADLGSPPPDDRRSRECVQAT